MSPLDGPSFPLPFVTSRAPAACPQPSSDSGHCPRITILGMPLRALSLGAFQPVACANLGFWGLAALRETTLQPDEPTGHPRNPNDPRGSSPRQL